MEFDTDLINILREVIQFLESLRDVQLSAMLENTRNDLLRRSRSTLVTFTSPEPYLDMNGSKGLPVVKRQNDVPEYVEADETQIQASQDYYESFQKIEDPKVEASSSSLANGTCEQQKEEAESKLVNIYASLSAEQTTSKCHKCGPVFRKEGKKLFVFEQYRSCWIGLVGSHLLIYGSERDSRPYMVLSIRGYMGRPAPNIVPRDQRRSKSAFEIFCPGYKTLQFIARTPKDMEQWVEIICQIGCNENNEYAKAQISESVVHPVIEITEPESQDGTSSEPERYQDVGSGLSNGTEGSLSLRRSPTVELIRDNKVDTDRLERLVENADGTLNLPALPARASRCLPSLPQIKMVPSYEPMEDAYDEDDIYHKIEDFRDVDDYQNVTSACDPTKKRRSTSKVEDLEAYDDVQAVAESLQRTKKDFEKESTVMASAKLTERILEEQYDDVQSSAGLDHKSSKTLANEREEKGKALSYDDVNRILTVENREKKELRKEKGETAGQNATKLVHKKSFLDRMRSRKESPKKVNKKGKRNKLNDAVGTSVEEVIKYDDIVSIVTNINENNVKVAEPSVYHSPPPPRPIYAKPPTNVNVSNNNEGQYYDDVGGYQESIRNSMNEEVVNEAYDSKVEFVQMKPEDPKDRAKTRKTDVESTMNGSCQLLSETNKIRTIDKPFELDSEHYKAPRTELFRQVQSVIPEEEEEKEEELYDDVAIVAEKARLRESTKREAKQHSACTNEPDVSASPGKPIQKFIERKHWNRFGSGRKDKDPASSEINKGLVNEVEEYDDCFTVSTEQHSVRLNTLQKLMNKVENSLGKTSSKSATLLPKSHASNNVT